MPGQIAYFTRTKSRCFLTIKEGPGGATVGEIPTTGKHEARAYCAAHGIKAWNF